MISVKQESPRSPDAARMLAELTDVLARITGSGGEPSFDLSDMDDPRAVFAIARNERGGAVGCGAIRPLEADIAEIKRLFAREKRTGVGTALLAYLENRAKELGYKALRLETRKVNERAVAFYLARGYRPIDNYGKYAGRDEALCFEKKL